MWNVRSVHRRAFIGVETASSVGAAADPTRDGSGLFGGKRQSIDGTGASSGSFFGVNGAKRTGVSPPVIAPVAPHRVGQKPAVGSAAARSFAGHFSAVGARPAASSAFTIRRSRRADGDPTAELVKRRHVVVLA